MSVKSVLHFVDITMVKVLVRCVRLLRFIGILNTSDIGNVPVRDPKKIRPLAHIVADILIYWHILMTQAIILPQVVMRLYVSISLKYSLL